MNSPELMKYFCEYCHRNLKLSPLQNQRCPHCNSPEIIQTRGACYVTGCSFPQFEETDICEGHTRRNP